MIENKTTEFKREYTDDIKYAIVAFANTDGGKIYIGLNDDGSVRGVENIDETMLRVTNMVRDAVRPDITMFMDCGVEIIDEKTVIVLTIQRGTARPYYLNGKGIRPEGVYVRQGASSVPASETVILNLIKETSGDRYEDARSVNQQLTFEKTALYFKRKGIEFGDAQKRTLNIVGRDGTFSNLGMLLSDQCIHMIKMAVFDGSRKSIFRDRRELTGSLLQQLEDAYAYIDQFNHTRSEFERLERIDRRDYPTEALRETLLNAVVHRDYSISGPALISIFDDRIEVVTIGGLVRGISYDDIMLGVSVLRNQNLANVFYRLRLIEAYGTGMLKIRESYEGYDIKPQIEITDNAFKVTLPNVNYAREHKNSLKIKNSSEIREASPTYIETKRYGQVKDAREEIVVNLFKDRETIDRKDIEAALHVSQATAVVMIRRLVTKGILIKEGNGRNSRYRLGVF